MQIRIVAVGKIKEPFLREGIAEYEKRQVSPSESAEKAAVEREGERILAAIPPGSFIIALDVRGTHWSSEELADFFRKQELAGKNRISFIIGGDLGLSPAV